MDHQRIIFFLLLLAGVCHGQTTVPDVVTPPGSNQVQFWNGTAWGLREIVGPTISGTQITTVDNSVSNEGLLGVGVGTSTSSVLLTNTSTGTGVIINANAPLTISESASSNGGSITLGVPAEVDGSVTNEGQLSLTGNLLVNGLTLNSNTSGSSVIKIYGEQGIYAHRNGDTIFIGSNSTLRQLTSHISVTSTNTTMVNVSGTLIEQEDGSNTDFVIYLHYTTGGTTEGLQFRLEPTNPSIGKYWYDYNFPITGSRITGSIYNANTTITVPSSETGTNMAVIRGVVKSNAVGLGIISLQLQISAETGSTTVTVLNTGVTQF